MGKRKVMGEQKQQESKTAYSAPSVTELGEISGKTKATNRLSSGDAQFSVLAS